MSMFSKTLGKAKSASILRHVCDRNLHLEIHRNITKDKLCVVNSRFLACDDKRIYIDKPNATGDDVHVIEHGAELNIFFWHDDALLQFQSKVVSRFATISLNENKKITALSLTRPAELKPLQRRQDYRVKLIGSHDISINASRCFVEDEINEIDVDNFPDLVYDGVLIDLSISGAAIKLIKPGKKEFTQGECFFLQFTMNEGKNNEREFIMLSTVCYRKILNEGSALRLGVHFEPWPNERIHRKNKDDLQHSTTQVQLEKLRRAG